MKIEQFEPEVALVDVAMPKLNGIEVVRRIARPPRRTRILALTALEDGTHVRESLEAGAAGFVPKSAPGADLIRRDSRGRGRPQICAPTSRSRTPLVCPTGGVPAQYPRNRGATAHRARFFEQGDRDRVGCQRENGRNLQGARDGKDSRDVASGHRSIRGGAGLVGRHRAPDAERRVLASLQCGGAHCAARRNYRRYLKHGYDFARVVTPPVAITRSFVIEQFPDLHFSPPFLGPDPFMDHRAAVMPTITAIPRMDRGLNAEEFLFHGVRRSTD